jgi:hypothetical protein
MVARHEPLTERRNFLKKAGTIGLTAPATTLLLDVVTKSAHAVSPYTLRHLDQLVTDDLFHDIHGGGLSGLPKKSQNEIIRTFGWNRETQDIEERIDLEVDGFNWGYELMKANPNVSDDEAKKTIIQSISDWLVRWFMS